MNLKKELSENMKELMVSIQKTLPKEDIEIILTELPAQQQSGNQKKKQNQQPSSDQETTEEE